MKNICFIINNDLNHRNVLENGCGASEYLFYTTAKSLSTRFKVTIYNRSSPATLDSVRYELLPDNMNPHIENICNSVVIVQRQFDIAMDLHKLNPTNQYIVWCHDYLGTELRGNLGGCYSTSQVCDYFNKHHLGVVCVSHFHKDNVIERLGNVCVTPIYNGLFPLHFQRDNSIVYNKNYIIFASNWAKGLERVLNIGTQYYKINPDFRLILIKPVYCDWEPELDKYPFIEKRGCIKDKAEYCRLLQGCLCVFGTSFLETFGCVFAEALHLGVPVLGDRSIKSGYHEIIGDEFLVDFRKPEEVIEIIKKLRSDRPHVALDNKFYEEAVITEWDTLSNKCFDSIRMDSVTQKLLSLKKRNIATKYTAENLWEGFLNREPYNTFFKAFQNGDEYLMGEILRNYKSHYCVEFSSPEMLNIELLAKYNNENGTSFNVRSSEISNISNFGIKDTSKCIIGDNGNVVNTLSIRYYFTYLLLSKFLKDNINILEIGCCSPVGVMQNFLKYRNGEVNCILLCDLYPVLLMSYATVVHNFPELKILFYCPGSGQTINAIINEYDVVMIIPDYLNDFLSCKIEFCFNSYSFSEMTRDNLESYFSFLSKTTKYLISENKHLDTENKCFKPLLDYVPASFKPISTYPNHNCPDGCHDIIRFENTQMS